MAKWLLTALADDVAGLISAAVVAAQGSLSRVYVPLKELQDLAGLTVTVVPRESVRERKARRLWQRDYTVDVAVQKRAEDVEEVDELTGFVEQLTDVLESTDPLTVPVGLIGSKVAGPDPGHLDQFKVFTAVITLTYRGGRVQS